MDIGKRVRELREEHGLTITDLASRSALTRNAVSRIELGHRMPGSATVEKLAQGLGVDPGDLYSKEESALPLGEAPRKAGPDEYDATYESGADGERRENSLGAYRPRYNVLGVRPAENVEEALGLVYPATVAEVIEEASRPWIEGVNSQIDRWTIKLESGEFDLGEVREFWAHLEKDLAILNKQNVIERQPYPSQVDPYSLPAGRVIRRIDDLVGPLHDAVKSKYADSDLAKKMHQKQDERSPAPGIVHGGQAS